MRILEINESHYPVGGAEEYFFKITQMLREKGHRVKSLGFGDKNIQTKEKVIIEGTESNLGKSFWRLIPHPEITRKIRKTVQKFEPDVVHIHNINKYTFSMLIGIQGQNVLQTVHGFQLVCPIHWCVKKDTLEVCPGGFGLKCLKHRCFKWQYTPRLIPFFYTRNWLLKKIVNKYHTPSRRLKEYLIKHGFEPVSSIHLPADISKSVSSGEIKENRILYVGGLEKQKGVSQLLKAAEKLKKDGTKFNLRIVGKGPKRKKLERFVEKNNLSNSINLIGWISESELEKEYEEAKFVIVPSVWQETFSIVTQEALSTGTPVIGSRRGAIPQFVKDGENGFLFDPLNPDVLKERIERGLNLSKKKYQEMREKSIKFARKTYDPKTHLRKMENLLKDLI